MKKRIASLLVAVAVLFASAAFARDITVKYRDDPVDVDNGYFEEMELKSSSLVQEIYYDAQNQYLLVRLKSTFYHYCNIPAEYVSEWVNADSLGSYYRDCIKGDFGCRYVPVPSY